MPEFDDQELELKFSVPDEPNVRQLLSYDSLTEIGAGDLDIYLRMWRGAKALIDEWECPHVEPDTDLEEITSEQAVDVIKYVGSQIWLFRQSLKNVPKNS